MAIDSIEVTPNPATMAADGTVQFTGIVHYAENGGYPAGEDIDETDTLRWLTTDDTVAYVNNGIWNGGLCVGRSPGTISIGAWKSDFLSVPPPGLSPDDPPSDEYWVGWADLEVTDVPEPPPDPEGRFLVAFDDNATEPYPEWTRLDDPDLYPNLVASYTIDRGRAYELDRTDTGRATVSINDVDGLLDPTNTGSPWYGKVMPSLQACINRRDPVSGDWTMRFRGYIDELVYDTDPSQLVNRLVISLTDQFDRLGRAEMQPGTCGDIPPAGSEGQVYYSSRRTEDRMHQVLSDFGIPMPFRAILSSTSGPVGPAGVTLWGQVYSAGESPLAVIQEAADADFPGISNVFCDRRGRIAFRSRRAHFFPDDVASTAGGLWDYHTWKLGDGQAVNASPDDTAHVRMFGYSESVSKVINSAIATTAGESDDMIGSLLVANNESIVKNGVCSWSATNLLTYSTNDALAAPFPEPDGRAECQRFAIYYVENYKFATPRIQNVAVRTMQPSDPRAAATWQLLNLCDIGDLVQITVGLPGGGGFDTVEYFVEGVHEEVSPLGTDLYDNVTLRLDLSPRALYATDPWA